MSDHLTTTEIYLNLSPEDVIREFREKWQEILTRCPGGKPFRTSYDLPLSAV